ncbi:MAG: helix-turn-helix domain-containing protein [Lachnospiraceae bacterium]|nr:helix-turn-helix domain-containing protein [Lachnospiraceae bacterium]MCM1235938.1 helix-turn-helix domain-containing protein [Ruminococcus flavefaciens]
MKCLQYTEIKYMLTVQETAKLLNVSVHTVYRLIESGELSAVKVSPRKTMIKAEEIERFINKK